MSSDWLNCDDFVLTLYVLINFTLNTLEKIIHAQKLAIMLLFIYSTVLVKAYYIMAVIIYKPFSIRSCNENIFVALQRALL